MDISIIVPVYREEKNIPEFVRRVTPILESICNSYEIIFSMDPSPDQTEEVVLQLHAIDPRIKLLKFSRRFGQPQATLAGLHYSTGAAAVVIDVDLQDPPELISDMFQRFREGYDVIYAQRKSRDGEPWLKRVIAYLWYRLINRIADVNMPPNTGDFRLMSRRVVKEVLQLKESHGFLRGMVAVVGFKQTSIQYERKARYSGQSNYNRFFGSFKIGLNGVVCFSNYLLTLSSAFGFMNAGFAFVLAIAYFFMKLLGFPFPIGNPTIVILVLFMGGVQLICVGILGEYIGRIYDEVKQRPKFILDRSVGFLDSKPL